MTGNWKITVCVWPYSTGVGAAEDQKAAGERTQVLEVSATDIRDALRQAELFVQGIKTNPRVWQAPIKSIVFER